MSTKNFDFEVIVIGGGPGGSTISALLAKKGIKTAVFEREVYPRFHIGESLLPYSRDILEETGAWNKVSSGKYIKKFGAQFVDYDGKNELYIVFEDGLTNDHPMAYEVPRANFDTDLLETAKECGATVFQPEVVKDVVFDDDGVKLSSSAGEFRAKFIVDATGRDTFMGKRMNFKKENPDLNNVAVYAHYEGIQRNPGKTEGDIVVGILPNGAWSWFIPFLGERTSVGVVCHSSEFRKDRKDLESYLKNRIAINTSLKERMNGARRVSDIGTVSNYSFKCDHFAGDRWILVGDAGGFLDPVFSSGVHIAISSGKFASEHIARALSNNLLLSDESIKPVYEEKLFKGMARFKWIINQFYSMNFATDMKRVINRDHSRRAFTSALAGDVWNDNNPFFRMYAL